MSTLDGDKAYADLKSKVNAGDILTNQDLMSIVFLPMMKNSVEKTERFEQCVALSNEISDKDTQAKMHGLIGLLAEKFIKDKDILRKIKELMGMGIIFEMMREDGMKEGIKEGIKQTSIEIAKNLLKKGSAIEFVAEATGLEEELIAKIKSEINVA